MFGCKLEATATTWLNLNGEKQKDEPDWYWRGNQHLGNGNVVPDILSPLPLGLMLDHAAQSHN